MFDREYQCDICQHFFDHPVDACPVCGEPFYWLVVPAQTPSETQRIAFLQIMEDAVEGNIGRDFLTHGGNLWLPHNFWQYAGDGTILNTFAWIQNVQLIQHSNPQKSSYFDSQADLSGEDEGGPGFDTQPIPLESVHQAEERSVQPSPLSKPREILNKDRILAVSAKAGARELWPPIAIASFLILLGISYFCLCAQHNLSAIRQASTHEQQILP